MNEMCENKLRDGLYVIDQLKYLSEYIDQKCEALSADNDHETVLKKLLKMCVRLRKNCEVFEEILLREDTNVHSSIRSSNLVFTLYLLDIIGEENCRKLKNDQIQKFRTDLDIFTKNYLLQTSDPVFVNLYQLFCSDTEATKTDSAENQDIGPSVKSGTSSTDLIPKENSSQYREDIQWRIKKKYNSK